MSSEVPVCAEPSPVVVDRVVELIRDSKPVSALALLPNLEAGAPHWQSAKALTTAARLAERLNSRKWTNWHRLNYRRHPDDDYCFLYRLYLLGASLGPPRALRLLEARLQKPGLQPKHRADLLAAGAGFLGAMRDFERATRLMEESRSLRPDAPWLILCQASLLRSQDRREEALALCREAVLLQPSFASAMGTAASLLLELNRDAEAEQTLLYGCSISEMPDLRWALYSYYSERERPDEALHWLNEFERHSVLLPDAARRELRGNRASLLLLRGDLAGALAEAEASGSAYYRNLAASLSRENAAAGRRIRLPVGFVRQNHMTCAPATLAALAAYWGKPAPHPEIAEKICYDGTPAYSERRWAREHGLDGREFCVTAETARSLIARGVPFTLVTAWATSAHLQAVVGTDDRAGLLIIRDPTFAHYSEAHLEEFLKDYAAHGPRGMLVLPEEQRSRTDGLTLPEAELYDLLHGLESALQEHNRPQAQEWFDQLCARALGHRLTWQAQLSLAGYDDNAVKAHEAQNALAALFPDDAPMAWRAFRLNSPRRPREETLRELQQRITDPRCDDVFKSELARMLAEDNRTARRAEKLLHRLLRRNPADAQALTTLANCRWEARAFEDAIELFRLAACAADKIEVCATAYFNACRKLGRVEEGLGFLRRRAAALGHQSAGPHLTLAQACNELLRTGEALKALETGLALRPEDGELISGTARIHLACGHLNEAEQCLTRAKPLVPPQSWHRDMAQLEQMRGRLSQSILHWKAVLATESMALDAHLHLAQLIAGQHGPQESIRLLARTTAQWPWNMGFARLYVDWLRREGDPAAATELQRILAHNPADDWAWRELALELARRHRFDEAVSAAAESIRLTPTLAVSRAIYGQVLLAAERKDEARAALRDALTLDATCGVLPLLMQAASSVEDRRAALALMRTEMTRQKNGGEAISQFSSSAQALLTDGELKAVLEEAVAARPDIFETWYALGEHLISRQDPAALELTRQITARFPWVAGSWRIYSQACGEAGRKEDRLWALQRAVDLAPLWAQAGRELSELLEREGRVEAAFAQMDRVLRANPLDGPGHGMLADMLLRHGRTDEGLQALERAVEVECGYDWAWAELARQCRGAGTPARAEAAARRLLATRPDETRSPIVLVETLARLEQIPEALAEVETALQRWPKNLRLNELRAILLCLSGRRTEGIAACAPPVFGDAVPRELRARRAALLLDAAEYAEAQRILEDLVTSEPDYGWPRSLLYDLCRARGEHARCLELSRELARIEPDNAVAAGMLAESLIALGRTGEALAPVRRALEIDPRYAFAAIRLFDELLERRDLAAAREIAGLIERFQPGPPAHLSQARLALEESKPNEALRPALKLVESEDTEAPAALERLRESWKSRHQNSLPSLDSVITAAVREGRARNAAVSTAWAASHPGVRVSEHLREAMALPVSPGVRMFIVRDLLYRALEDGQIEAALSSIKVHWNYLRSETPLWGAVGLIKLRAGRVREAVEWLSDWRERKDREPWMIANLGVALVWDCGPLAAHDAWQEVVDAGASNVWPDAAAGLAFTCAIKGRKEEALRHLENLKGQKLAEEDKFSTILARSALAAAEGGKGSSPENRRRASALISEAMKAWPEGNRSPRGNHYRRELEEYVTRNGYDPAFAKLPQSKAPPQRGQTQTSVGGSLANNKNAGWFILIALITAFNVFRLGSTKSSSPPSPRVPVYTPPKLEPMGPSLEDKLREMERKYPEPFHKKPEPPPNRESTPGTPREPFDTRLKY